MTNERHTGAWKAIEDTPANADSIKLRSNLMVALENHITRAEL